MTPLDRLRQLVDALPDGAAVTLTRRDLAALVAESPAPASQTADLSVEEVAKELKRAPSTVRGWLIAKALRGYKLNRRDWRVPRSALREYLEAQAHIEDEPDPEEPVDISAWRKLR